MHQRCRDQLHRLTISLLGQDEEVIPLLNIFLCRGLRTLTPGRIVAQFNAGRAPHMASGDESLLPVAAQITAALPQLDSYHVVAAFDGSEFARANHFRVTSVLQIPGL